MTTVVVLLVVCVILTLLRGASVGYLVLTAYEHLTGRPPRPAPPASATPTLDVCETCGAPATHELAGDIEFAAGEAQAWSACVACYCDRHAPPAAVQVR